ncbi:hypothetical protein FKM82_025103 [Ascaphus truei]
MAAQMNDQNGVPSATIRLPLLLLTAAVIRLAKQFMQKPGVITRTHIPRGRERGTGREGPGEKGMGAINPLFSLGPSYTSTNQWEHTKPVPI